MPFFTSRKISRFASIIRLCRLNFDYTCFSCVFVQCFCYLEWGLGILKSYQHKGLCWVCCFYRGSNHLSIYKQNQRENYEVFIEDVVFFSEIFFSFTEAVRKYRDQRIRISTFLFIITFYRFVYRKIPNKPQSLCFLSSVFGRAYNTEGACIQRVFCVSSGVFQLRYFHVESQFHPCKCVFI